MRSLHGQDAVAGAVVAMGNAGVASSETGQLDIRPRSLPKEYGSSWSPPMPNVVLRLSEGLRRLYHVSVKRRPTVEWHGGENRHGFENSNALSASSDGLVATSKEPWFTEYLRGVSMELYSAGFSSAFEGMTFVEAAKVCMKRLELVLIAILAQSTEGEETENVGQYPFLAINPPNSRHSIIREGTIGFFICDSQEIATRATNYCLRCHRNVTTYDQIRRCGCRSHGLRDKIRSLRDRISAEITDGSRASSRLTPQSPFGIGQSNEYLRPTETPCFLPTPTASASPPKFETSTTDLQQLVHDGSAIDITGVYHWCPKRSLASCVLPNNHSIETTMSDEAASKSLRNHILVCLLAGNKAPQLGLRSFILPLRASNIGVQDLRPIVFLSSYAAVSEEWHEMENFPNVYLLPGSPLNRRDLWAARIQLCSVCVVIGVAENLQVDDPYMLDKEAILCSLNIRALKIPPSLRQSVSDDIAARSSGAEIPLLTALAMDSNIHFLDPDDFEADNSELDIFLTVPFARGLAFTGSVLDALVSTAYFDRNAMTLIRHLVTGGTTPVLEQWAAYGGDFYDNLQVTDIGEAHVNEFLETLRRNNSRRPTIAQLSFNDPRLAAIINVAPSGSACITFGELFCRALGEHGILCLGLFRLNAAKSSTSNCIANIQRVGSTSTITNRPPVSRRPSACNPPEPVKMRILFEERQDPPPLNIVDRLQLPLGPRSANNRFVITSPPYHFPVNASDLVFCLITST
ncbi:unnamed protein product [Mesocestoides corti]|nr:unnamed protein product [Mesocestoides corti]